MYWFQTFLAFFTVIGLSPGLALPSLFTSLSLPPAGVESRDTVTCPFNLPNVGYEFPHLIIPINTSDVALGNSFFPYISPNDCSTIFNFDIPPNHADQQCKLYFSFPSREQMSTSDYKWTGADGSSNGPGTLDFTQYVYNTGANVTTTGNNQPPTVGGSGSVGSSYNSTVSVLNIVPGNSYEVWVGPCGSGGVMSWKMSSPDSWLLYFQDWNSCPIGLWILYA